MPHELRRAHALLTVCAGCLLAALAPRDVASQANEARADVRGSSRASLMARWDGEQLDIPSDPELLEQMREAHALRLRREYTRTLDTVDPGELLEDATMSQPAIDAKGFGVEAMFAVGDDLFELMFRTEYGLGNGLAATGFAAAGGRPAPNMRRVQQGAFGGPDAYSCASCHSLGGLDGAGTQTQAAFLGADGRRSRIADTRNPPHLLGLGPVERLAAEMTRDLHAAHAQALSLSRERRRPVRQALRTKGVDFGALVAHPDGRTDTSDVVGISADLIVRPFGWKGHQSTLRAMAREAFRMHLGVLSTAEESWLYEGELPRADYGDGGRWDADADGVRIELDDGMLTTMVAYLAQLQVPTLRPPSAPAALERFARGQRLFDEIGCEGCHRRELLIDDPELSTRPDLAAHAASPAVVFDVSADGERPKPEIRHGIEPRYVVELYSDLKRHAMGPELASPRAFLGIEPEMFLTRPLWGLADTAPYLHDGRAATIDEAIRLHGGEAAAARTRYTELPEASQIALRTFLASLTREQSLLIP